MAQNNNEENAKSRRGEKTNHRESTTNQQDDQGLLNQILEEIQDTFKKSADPKQAERYRRYFKEGYDPYGIHHDLWHRHRDYFLKKYWDKLGFNGFLDLADKLLVSGKYEEASLSIHFAKPFHDQFTKDTFTRIGAWLENGICNWAHTDVLCSDLLSYFFKHKIVSYQDMSGWRESPSKWKRRAVPVGMLTIVKNETNYQPLLDFISPMMMDAERVVHQGLGWLLRDIWKIEPKLTEAFLLEWKNSAPRLIIQYATEKMSPENKARFKKEKSKTKGMK